MKALIVPRDLTGESLRRGSTAAVTASAASVYFPVYALVAYPLVLYYLCHNSLVVLGLSYLCVTLLDSIVHSGQYYCCGHVIPELSV